jgi:hypothetical protein
MASVCSLRAVCKCSTDRSVMTSRHWHLQNTSTKDVFAVVRFDSKPRKSLKLRPQCCIDKKKVWKVVQLSKWMRQG